MEQATLSPRDAARVYFDGACPVCRREIAWYRNWRGADKIEWLDLQSDAIPDKLDRDALLKRFTVQRVDGVHASGAAGFIALWRALPATTLLGKLTDNALMRAILEVGYRGFLRIRKLWRRPS